MFGLITLGRGGVLPEIRLLYRKGVCRVPEGRIRKVREDPDDNRRRRPQHRSKFVREEIGRLDGVELQFLPPGCPDLKRGRGGVAPDETRDPGRAVRLVQLHAQRHRQVAEVVPAKT